MEAQQPRNRKKRDPPELNEFLLNEFHSFNYVTRSPREKRDWRSQVASALNAKKFTDEVWDDSMILKKLSNLGIKNIRAQKPRRSSMAPVRVQTSASSNPSAPVRTISRIHTPWEKFMERSRRTMMYMARSSEAFVHNTNRGNSNEHLVREFLSRNLPRALVQVGSGELIGSGELEGVNQNPDQESVAVASGRQRDVVLYSPRIPVLCPPGAPEGLCLFPDESVIAIVEVKTVLKNADLIKEVISAAEACPTALHFVFAFTGEVGLDGVLPADRFPENVLGIFDLQHGSLIREEDVWRCIEISVRDPLLLFHAALLRCVYDHARDVTSTPAYCFDIGSHVLSPEELPEMCRPEEDDDLVLVAEGDVEEGQVETQRDEEEDAKDSDDVEKDH